jgi:hypothetical protein
MHEFHRQAYLEAIGIQALVPCFVLPGAKTSVLSDAMALDENRGAALAAVSSDTENAAGTASESRHLQNTTANAKKSVAAVLEQIVSRPEHSPNSSHIDVAPDIEAPSKLPEQEEAVPFMLAILYSESGIVIVDEVPKGQVFSKYQEVFIRDVLFSLGIKSGELQRDMFHWPLRTKGTAGTTLDTSRRAAQETLSGYIRRHIGSEGQINLLCLGALTMDLVTGAINGDEQALGTAVQVCYCSSVNSASAMMQPANKAKLWRDLQLSRNGGEQRE